MTDTQSINKLGLLKTKTTNNEPESPSAKIRDTFKTKCLNIDSRLSSKIIKESEMKDNLNEDLSEKGALIIFPDLDHNAKFYCSLKERKTKEVISLHLSFKKASDGLINQYLNK